MNIIVFFGGESCEHDISIITGEQFISKCNEYLYNVIPVYISKTGDWYTGDILKDIDKFSEKDFLKSKKIKRCFIMPNDSCLYVKTIGGCKILCKIDCAVLCLHGLRGEDGCVAGVLELSKIPYTAPNILGSSVCLDKGVFKTFCKGLGVKVVDGFVINEYDYLSNKKYITEKIEEVGYPVILKPCRQGSSIGISIAKNRDELFNVINNVFNFDKKVLVERFMSIDKEVNIALFNNKGEMIFSNTEEPVGNDDILSFDDKYLKNAGGFETIKRIVPARIDYDELCQIKSVASMLYNELELFGIVRFDFLISDSVVYINEVNTIPGSMANYLFDKDLYGYARLVDMLVSNAVHRFEEDQKTLKILDTEVLKMGFNGFKK